MLCDILDQVIFENGFNVEDYAFTGRYDAMMVGDTILINSRIAETKARNSLKIHEYGHLSTLSFDLRYASTAIQERYEYLADRAGALQFITFDSLLDAYKAGMRTCEDYCEHLEITENFFLRTLAVYSRVYGLKHIYNGYLFVFDPLHIKKCRKNNKMGFDFGEDD